MVIIDSGVTHNFISSPVLKRLGIPVTPSKTFRVALGTGDALHAEGECKRWRLGTKLTGEPARRRQAFGEHQ